MAELRSALADLVAALPEPAGRPVDIERSLRLDKKLAWQVFRLVRSSGFAELANVPSAPSVRRLLAAARKRRVPKALTDRAAAAFASFDEFARTHAGDREGLLSMFGGQAAAAGDQYELKVRRAAFRANAHLWGAQAGMQVRTVIHSVRPGAGYIEDDVLISADIGLQRLRQRDPLVMLRWLVVSDRPGEQDPASPPAAPPGRVEHQVGLIPEFCSQPLPKMLAQPAAEGGVETELVIPAGRTGAVTLYSSQLFERAAVSKPEVYFGRMFVTIPVETMVWELLVPAGRSDPATVRTIAYGRRAHPERVYEGRKADLLPNQGEVSYMGALEAVPPLDGAPAHAQAVRHVLHNHGWLGQKFDVYRSRVQFPVLHSLLSIQVNAAR